MKKFKINEDVKIVNLHPFCQMFSRPVNSNTAGIQIDTLDESKRSTLNLDILRVLELLLNIEDLHIRRRIYTD